MDKQSGLGYLSTVLRRGAHIVRRSNSPDRRTLLNYGLRHTAAHANVNSPLEIESFSSPVNRSHNVDSTSAQTKTIQHGPLSQSSRVDVGQIPPEPNYRRNAKDTPVRSPEEHLAPRKTSRSTETAHVPKSHSNPSPPGQRIGRAETHTTFQSSRTVEQPIVSSGENASREKLELTEAVESDSSPLLRARDAYSDVRRASLRETTRNQADLEVSRSPHSEATAATTSPNVSAEPVSSPKNPAKVFTESRETHVDGPVIKRESAHVDDSREVFVPEAPTPRLPEAVLSQNPHNANQIQREPSPKLTINRLDIQIVDQTPVAPTFVPVRAVVRQESVGNIDRYQLGHLDLIF